MKKFVLCYHADRVGPLLEICILYLPPCRLFGSCTVLLLYPTISLEIFIQLKIEDNTFIDDVSFNVSQHNFYFIIVGTFSVRR